MYRSPWDNMEEVIDDFERMIRLDSRVDALLDYGHAGSGEIEHFYFELSKLAEKYIPDKADIRYDGTTYEKALIVYSMLFKRFRQILAGDFHP